MTTNRRSETNHQEERPLDPATAAALDSRRCWGCRRLWPRRVMQWGSLASGPAWNPRQVRVLRCPECLA